MTGSLHVGAACVSPRQVSLNLAIDERWWRQVIAARKLQEWACFWQFVEQEGYLYD